MLIPFFCYQILFPLQISDNLEATLTAIIIENCGGENISLKLESSTSDILLFLTAKYIKELCLLVADILTTFSVLGLIILVIWRLQLL